MTKERAFDQANIEFRQDGKTRFVHQKIADPENFLITKYSTVRRGWRRFSRVDKAAATPNSES